MSKTYKIKTKKNTNKVNKQTNSKKSNHRPYV